VTPFSRQKTLKSKNKKHRIFWNTKFYHPAKFELKRIKNAKVVPTSQYFASHTPTVPAKQSKKTCGKKDGGKLTTTTTNYV